jgi:hypothetical protein
MKLHFDMVTQPLKELLGQLMQVPALHAFRLVGGTNLALQLGHRQSVDIDLFAGGGGSQPKQIAEALAEKFNNQIHVNRIQQHGLSAIINNIKVDLYDWKVPFALDALVDSDIRLASLEDIFAFKCEAVLGRRVEKDFVDIAEITSHKELSILFDVFAKRYPFIQKSAVTAILLKPEIFERDTSIVYSNGKTFDLYVTSLTQALQKYEQAIESKQLSEIANRHQRIQDLINQKRNKPS